MTILAYQTGVLYPGFVDADRQALARVFERFGFLGAARRLRDIDPHRALSSVARRIGSHRKDSLRVQPLALRSLDHVVAFQVEKIVQQDRELAGAVAGARVFSSARGLSVGAPVSGPAIPDCIALAERLRRRADRLTTHADTRAVSRAVNAMSDEARAFRFISKGAYMLPGSDAVAVRVAGCLRALRVEFYDEERRIGIRAAVVEVIDHNENFRAVSDAVTDEAERQIALFVEHLQAESGSDSVRPETLAKRRRAASSLVESLTALSVLLGTSAARLAREAAAIQGAYETARSGAELSVPLELSGPTDRRRALRAARAHL